MEPFVPATNWSHGWNLMGKIMDSDEPRVYINHVWWTNFTQARKPRPQFTMQIMRDVVSREVSTFYYGMWGPRAEAKMLEDQHSAMETLQMDHPPTVDDFVLKTEAERKEKFACRSEGHPFNGQDEKGNLMTRYFCGFNPVCRDICSEAALMQAKHNLVNEYHLVGFLEDLETTLGLMEQLGPSWFDGILATFKSAQFHKTGKDQSRTTQNRTANDKEEGVAPPPSNMTKEIIRAWNCQDEHLYRYARVLFHKMARRCGFTPFSASQLGHPAGEGGHSII
jgi:hypothetical protein